MMSFPILKLTVVEYAGGWYAQLYEDGVFLQNFLLSENEAQALRQKLDENSPELADIMLDYLMQVNP